MTNTLSELHQCPICGQQPVFTKERERYRCNHEGTPYKGIFDEVAVSPYTEESASRILWNTLGEKWCTEAQQPKFKYEVWWKGNDIAPARKTDFIASTRNQFATHKEAMDEIFLITKNPNYNREDYEVREVPAND